MSFHWIKIETTTPDKPEVVAMAAKLRIKDPDTVTGKLIRLWAWADANSVDGHAISITRNFIDRLTACRGFATAMESVGWLVGVDGMLTFPGFDRHNGASAKRRAVESRRQEKHRAGKPKRDKRHAGSVTSVTPAASQKALPEEEIEKEKNGTTTTTREAKAEKLISAYARPSFDRPALEAVLDCLRRFDGKFTFDQIHAGVAAVTAAVKEWPEDERVTYLPSAANFFREDGWRKHPTDWVSRREAKKRLNGHGGPVIPVDIGGRRPAGVLDITAPAPAGPDDDQLKF